MLGDIRDRLEARAAGLLSSPAARDLEAIATWKAGTEAIHGTGGATPGMLASQASLLLVSACTHAHVVAGGAGTTLEHGVLDFLDTAGHASPVARACTELVNAALGQGRATGTARDGLGQVVPAVTRGIVEPLLATRRGEPVDRMSPIHQALFSRQDKHASGEHYTPPELAGIMVDRAAIEPSWTVLDPACGAGAFLVPVAARLRLGTGAAPDEWYRQLGGWDVNPFSVVACIVNAWLAMGDPSFPIEHLFDTITVQDALRATGPTRDLVVGNPPWVTLKDFATASGQRLARDAARELGIAPGPHDIPQLELASVIHARCFRSLVKRGGWSSLVMPASILDGKHCSKVRRFQGADLVEIWLFAGAPIFPRSTACLLERRGPGDGSYFDERASVPARAWTVSRGSSGAVGTSITLVEAGRSTLVPDRIDASRGTVGRLVHHHETSGRIPTGTPSPYKQSCYNGATIFPQLMLFVRVAGETRAGGVRQARIVPDLAVRAKTPWTFLPYGAATVEAGSVFDLVKGSELHPFGLLEPWKVFLPLVDDGSRFTRQENPATLAWKHFSALEAIYEQHRSTRGRVPDLWTRVNFDNELLNASMAKPWKVVFPDCGSIMAAAIAPRRVIVEHALHYIGVDDEREARYLLGVLNAPCIATDVLKRKSERHIGQLVLDYPVPAHDPADATQAEISALAGRMEERARNITAAHLESVLAANEGKLQCAGCHGFVDPGAWSGHERACKKAALLAKLPPDVPRHVVIDASTRGQVHVRPTRRAMKQVLDRDPDHARDLRDLDGLVRGLPGIRAPGGGG